MGEKQRGNKWLGGGDHRWLDGQVPQPALTLHIITRSPLKTRRASVALYPHLAQTDALARCFDRIHDSIWWPGSVRSSWRPQAAAGPAANLVRSRSTVGSKRVLLMSFYRCDTHLLGEDGGVFDLIEPMSRYRFLLAAIGCPSAPLFGVYFLFFLLL